MSVRLCLHWWSHQASVGERRSSGSNHPFLATPEAVHNVLLDPCFQPWPAYFSIFGIKGALCGFRIKLLMRIFLFSYQNNEVCL